MSLIPFMLSLAEGLLRSPFKAQGMSPAPSPVSVGDAAVAFGTQVPEFTWLFLKMVFAMIFVIALAIVVIRFIIPKLTFNRGNRTRTDLKVVDRIPLDARKVLYVLQVEGRRILISASEHYIGLIAELEPNHDEED